MNATVNIQPITSLPVDNTPQPTDTIVIVSGGTAFQTQVQDLTSGLPVATESSKGLISATDKTSLDGVVGEVYDILNPNAVTIASAGTITIPPGVSFVIITGNTPINVIDGLTNYFPVQFYYPSGSTGLTILGYPVSVGDAPLTIIQTAS